MQPRSLEDRVTLLEKNLQGLPERVGSLETRVTELTVEFVQFRGEVRAEFSATREELRKEIRDGDNALHKKIDELGAEMRTLFENAIERIKIIKHG
jgi:predicted  nucleic acid-binding Zn-ribbon protein